MSTLEARKAIEIGHYDRKAAEWRRRSSERTWDTDVHGLRHAVFSSYAFFESLLEGRCDGRKVLDYGCGTGIHSILPALLGAEVTGIDLSRESLEIARERARRSGVAARTTFMEMDCERLDFPDRSFDLIIDGGTFSSIDLGKSLPELSRVLRRDGRLIGIETLGHNPLTNLKRKLNRLRGARTAWAEEHILRVEDFESMRRHFGGVEARYFHLLGLLVLPFARLPGAGRLLRAADALDSRLLRRPGLARYGFKTVFELSMPAP